MALVGIFLDDYVMSLGVWSNGVSKVSGMKEFIEYLFTSVFLLAEDFRELINGEVFGSTFCEVDLFSLFRLAGVSVGSLSCFVVLIKTSSRLRFVVLSIDILLVQASFTKIHFIRHFI